MKSTASEYFSQKNWTFLEIICVLIIVVFAIVATFIDGGGPIGFPVLILVSVFLIIYKSNKASDTEIDDLIKDLIDKNVEAKDLSQFVCSFDFSNGKCRKGKDGKLRSSIYVMACFSVTSDATQIDVHTIDLIDAKVQVKHYLVPKRDRINLVEKSEEICGVRKTVRSIENNSIGFSIPVTSDDVHSFELIEKILHDEK